jgi:uncharacterized protein (DUF1697 family)
MTSYVALVRAVNVGGRKLLMADLKRIAADLGLGAPRTFIASGNLLFTSAKSEATVNAALERALTGHMGNKVDVMVRTADELAAVVAANPFHKEPGDRVVAIFLDHPPPAGSSGGVKNRTDERIAQNGREIYVHYPSGMGRSNLRIPAAARGTARNMNSVAKLARLAKEQG